MTALGACSQQILLSYLNDSVTFSFISEWTQKEMVDESAEKVTIIYLHSRHSSRTNQVLNISWDPPEEASSLKNGGLLNFRL